MTSTKETPEDIAWYSVPTQEAARRLNVVPDRGLEDYEATRRLAEHGPNELPKEPPRKPGTKMVNRPQLVHWFASGFLVAAIVLAVLEWGPGKPSTTRPSVNMTMAFAIVSFTAVNLGLVMRREREPAWSRPMFPYLGWIILGWVLTWAAVQLNMLQQLLNTESLTGRQWLVVLGLSLVMPAAVGVDTAIQLHRQRNAPSATTAAVVIPSPRPRED